ncbi:MAG: histidine kinase [Urechidicola sp.]|nr:histidine kinase [Urechidicola sp.]
MNRATKNIIIVFVIGAIIFVIGNLIYKGNLEFSSTQSMLINFSFYQLYSFVLGYSNMYFFDYLEKRTWNEGDGAKRILIGVVGSFFISMLGLFVLRFLTEVLYNGNTVEYFIENESFANYIFGMWITTTMIIVFHFIYFYTKYQKKKVKESQIVAKTESAKFESLKNQLDPHFLFNSLNVLTSLIDENPRQAEKFTTKLSKVYRYVLEHKDKDLIPLEDELRFAKSYMELLKMRFEDGISFNIPDSVSNPELKIVPLSLQLLLENAVKHNVITSNNPLEINIYEDDGYLVVANNINLKNSLEKSTKVGLKNINQRYSLITKAKVEITNTNQLFKVRLPLLTQKIKIMQTDYINDNERYHKAKKRVELLKGFYGSLIAYCIVIPFLIYLNHRVSPGFQWFWFPVFGWGLGITIQAFQVFGLGMSWEDRKIKEIMDKDNNY